MKSAKLNVVLHSGKGLKDVKHFGIMNPYAKIWISGDGIELKRKTNIAKKGDSDPVWECSIDFENVLMKKEYNLVIEIKHDATMFDRKIGAVQVSFADLLNEDKSGDRVSYWLMTSAEKQGQIILSFSFSDVVERPDEDGASTSTSQVPVKKKRDKAKKLVKRVGTKISTFAAEIAVVAVVGEMIDGDEEDGAAK